jgi:hypothetical protein
LCCLRREIIILFHYYHHYYSESLGLATYENAERVGLRHERGLIELATWDAWLDKVLPVAAHKTGHYRSHSAIGCFVLLPSHSSPKNVVRSKAQAKKGKEIKSATSNRKALTNIAVIEAASDVSRLPSSAASAPPSGHWTSATTAGWGWSGCETGRPSGVLMSAVVREGVQILEAFVIKGPKQSTGPTSISADLWRSAASLNLPTEVMTRLQLSNGEASRISMPLLWLVEITLWRTSRFQMMSNYSSEFGTRSCKALRIWLAPTGDIATDQRRGPPDRIPECAWLPFAQISIDLRKD